MANWFIRKTNDNVTIYDSLDTMGNGNIRFSGTLDCALLMFAQQTDDDRKKIKELETELEKLKKQLFQ